MKIILAHCGNGYAGCDAEDLFIFEDGESEKIINEDIFLWSRDQGDSYAYVHFGWNEKYSDEEYDDYMENYVTYDWSEISYDEAIAWCENYGYDPEDYLKYWR